MNSLLRCTAIVAGLLAGTPAVAQTEIQFWHAMAGEMGQRVEKLANDFNNSQKDFKVVAVYKGTYPEVMTGAIAAFRAKQAPHIVQVFEVGTATMMAAKGAIYPMHELMKDGGVPFDPSSYLPAVSGYYSDIRATCCPFRSTRRRRSSTTTRTSSEGRPRSARRRRRRGRTWRRSAKKLQAAGVPCGFTTEWPSFIQFENLSAYHNQPISTQENGFAGLDAELKLNGPVQVKHLQNLVDWQKTKIFDYGGRGDSSKPKFFSGECGMTVSSAAARARHHHQHESRCRHGAPALLRRRERCAAELDHRRGEPVGAARAEAGGLQGRRSVLRVSLPA